MNDLISRRAAIDALERQKDKTAKGEIGSFYNTIIQHDIDVIVELPSAQPDVTDTNVGDTIYRQDAINLLKKWSDGYAYIETETESAIKDFQHLPSAQPEISRLEQELHGKTPEEQYEFIDWLMFKFALAYTDSRLAVVEWLRGEKEDG